MKYYKLDSLYCAVDKEDGPFWYYDERWIQTLHLYWKEWSRPLDFREVSKLEVLVACGSVVE